MVKYSQKMQDVFSLSQIFSNRFSCQLLESWHLLLGLIYSDETIASLTFHEFDQESTKNDYIAAAIIASEKSFDETITTFNFYEKSFATRDILLFAEQISHVTNSEEVGTEHVLMAMLLKPHLMPIRLLTLAGFDLKNNNDNISIFTLRRSLEKHAGFTKEEIKAIHNLKKPKVAKANNFVDMMKPTSNTGELSDYTRDLTALAQNGELDPVVGRDKEISRMIQILSRKTKNNPVLVGDAGVGKTALAYGLAQRITSGEIPYELRDMRVLELDMMSVIAGTRFRGDFEERMNQIIDEVETDGRIILFVDEIHTIMGSGSGMDSTLDAANILKPGLSRGTLHMIGATTQEEYQKHIEKDAALARRFAKITIEEPSIMDAYDILKGLKVRYEKYHNVTISDDILLKAVKTAKRYLTNKNLPDSAIDLIDETSAAVQITVKKNQPSFLSPIDEALLKNDIKAVTRLLKKENQVTKPKTINITEEHLMKTLSRLSGIPVEKMTQEDSQKYLNLEKELHKRVIGQDAAISAISRAIRRNKSGIRVGKRPIGSFMFLGPTGVGKTELAKALAEVLFDDESALIRFDMSEYMEKFSASRLNGAPPGYVGYDEGGELTEKVRQKPYSVLLFDEVEKAHPYIFNVMLQILDDGILTDSRGRKVDFSNTLIIMTSNLGATALRDEKTVGFSLQSPTHDHTMMEKRIFEELKKTYRPEFINRIDEKVVFHSLSQENMQDVVKIMVKPLIKQLAEKEIVLKIQPSALKQLAIDGYDPDMGARPLRRILQTKIEDKLAELILSGELSKGQTLKIGKHKDNLKFDIV